MSTYTLNLMPGLSEVYTSQECDDKFEEKGKTKQIVDEYGSYIRADGDMRRFLNKADVGLDTPWSYRCKNYPELTEDHIKERFLNLVWSDFHGDGVFGWRNTITCLADVLSSFPDELQINQVIGDFEIVSERVEYGTVALQSDIADWARAGQEPPTPGGHPDYIEDANGNKIIAAGKITTYTEGTQWAADREGHVTEAEIAFMDEMDAKLVGWEPEVSNDVVTNFPELPAGWYFNDAVYFHSNVVTIYVGSSAASTTFSFSKKTVEQKIESVLVRSVNGTKADEKGDVQSSVIKDKQGNQINADRTCYDSSTVGYWVCNEVKYDQYEELDLVKRWSRADSAPGSVVFDTDTGNWTFSEDGWSVESEQGTEDAKTLFGGKLVRHYLPQKLATVSEVKAYVDEQIGNVLTSQF